MSYCYWIKKRVAFACCFHMFTLVDLSWCITLSPLDILESLRQHTGIEYLNISFCCPLEKTRCPGSPQPGGVLYSASSSPTKQMFRCWSEGSLVDPICDSSEAPSGLLPCCASAHDICGLSELKAVPKVCGNVRECCS